MFEPSKLSSLDQWKQITNHNFVSGLFVCWFLLADKNGTQNQKSNHDCLGLMGWDQFFNIILSELYYSWRLNINVIETGENHYLEAPSLCDVRMQSCSKFVGERDYLISSSY